MIGNINAKGLTTVAVLIVGASTGVAAQSWQPCAVKPSACFSADGGSATTYPEANAPDQALKLHHISLFSNNHAELAEWYRDMLGFEIAGRFVAKRPDGVEIEIIRLTMNGLWLNISRLPGITDRDRRVEYSGWRHIAFGTGDVQKTWQALKDRGAEVLGNGSVEFDPPGYRVAFTRDPDGNFIEFDQDVKAPAL